jgi:hypothetical protein
MKQINFILRIVSLIGLSSLLSSLALAAPSTNICVDESCKKKANVTISNDTWRSIEEIYATPYPTDKDEQDNIVASYALLRADVYNTLSQNNTLGDSASVLYELNSTETNYKNAKILLSVLLDNHFIKRHYLRKTIKRSTWSKAFSWSGISNMSGMTSDGLLLQSLSDAQQYVFSINGNDFSVPASISTYTK